MVEYFEGQDGQHYWHIKSANGQVVAQSEGYTRAADAKRGYAALVSAMLRDSMKHIIVLMFQGWQAHEQSYDADEREYTRDQTDCMMEQVGGDPILGSLLHLFDHWGNDIQTMAAHLGIALERVDDDDSGSIVRIRTDIPPAPSPDAYWDKGQWVTEPPESADIDPRDQAIQDVAIATAAAATDKRRQGR